MSISDFRIFMKVDFIVHNLISSNAGCLNPESRDESAKILKGYFIQQLGRVWMKEINVFIQIP